MWSEAEAIKDLVVKSREWWKQLEDIYVQESKQALKADEDQAKIDDLKSSLGL
jgi:succinate dehydrogenase/fumarate reductase-like Fe-S protein